MNSAIASAEAEAIRRALALAHGNKSHAARLLRTNYTTLHTKMKRFGISAREFRSA
ncbi:MAG TPA: helix-turn-helix domain-containing protein [Methylomirabilota bacterium]|nr:helix-turn-helix domain-containing protein [Methylomirabilota bacterium]